VEESCFQTEEGVSAAVVWLQTHLTTCDQVRTALQDLVKSMRPDFSRSQNAVELRRRREAEVEDLSAAVSQIREQLTESQAAIKAQDSTNAGLVDQAKRSREKIATLSRLAAPTQQLVVYRKGKPPVVVPERRGADPSVSGSMALLHGSGEGLRVTLPTDRDEALGAQVQDLTAQLTALLEEREAQLQQYYADVLQSEEMDTGCVTAAAAAEEAEARARQTWEIVARSAEELCLLREAAMREQRALWREEMELVHRVSATEARLREERQQRGEAIAQAVARSNAELAEEKEVLRQETERIGCRRANVEKKAVKAEAEEGERIRRLKVRVEALQRQASRESRARHFNAHGFQEEVRLMTRNLAAAERRARLRFRSP